ncbi:oxidoreductase [Agarivorans sp. DSG3-1]|uniref:oxidoreductase n=1 Tax=Agarivorans sp. DSG3-1 TaxID=3342249 RepID=UPI00398E9DED
MTNFVNSKVIVFGSNGVLGSTLVQSILDKGGQVIAVDNFTPESELQSQEIPLNNIERVNLDVTNESNIISFFNSLEGGIIGAVNCTYPRNKSYGTHFLDVSLDSFNENIALHLGSSFLISQQCVKYNLKYNEKFSLVNISSVYGIIAPRFSIYDHTNMTMPVEYSAIKSALIHLNKYVSKYVKNSCFRVNSVSPGGILNGQPNEFCDSYKEYTNGKGMLDAKDVVGAVIFLLSEDSNYITGQNIVVDDGFSL